MSHEQKGQEGKAERFTRLLTIKSLGLTAVLAAGAALIPPIGAPLAAAAVVEGLQAGGFAMAHGHYKSKRGKRP
jgi:hypothetical protein